ncbi:MAG: PAS domain S-box protein [Candidatus Bathyarchaeota archaeon]|nr:PAS domain S-box protein [Candidatus Bathyarchaeota archaeon]
MVASGAQPVNSMRVLHIDDNPDYMAITKMYLESFDPEMEVVSSCSPVDSLPLIENMEFDCVLCDYLMPEMDGIELCRRIRRTSDVPFIIHTGQGSEEVASIAFDAGVDDYIRKEPRQSHYQVLAKRVRQAVEKHWVEGLYRNVLENCRDGVVIIKGTRIVYANQAMADFVGVSGPGELLGTDVLDLVVARDRGRLQSLALSRQRGESQPTHYEITFQRPDGEPRVLDISSSLINYKGRPASLGIVRDVSEKVRGRERLAALHSCTIGLASAESIEEIAIQTLDSMAEVFDFRWGDFSILEAGRLLPVHFKGVTHEEFEILGLDGPGVIARAARTAESQLVLDTRVDEDYLSTLIDGNITTLSELAVPIKSNGNVIGVINLESPVLDGFSGDDQKLLEIFSQYVASAVVRIRNEGLLKASEEKCRNILESSLDGITVTKDTKLIFVNPRFAEMLGYDDPSELLGRSSWDLVAPEYQVVIQDRGNKRREGDRSTFRYELNFVRKDGSSFYVEAQTSAIDFEGNAAVLGIHREINERMLLKEELRASEERYKSLFALSPFAIVISDLKGRITDVNDTVMRMTGFTRDELIGKHFSRLPMLSKREIPRYLKIFNSFMGGNPIGPLEIPVQSREGTTGTLEMHVGFVEMEGEKVGIQAIFKDITLQKQTEEELRASEERYRSLIELAPDGIMTLNLKGEVTSINTAFMRLTGYSKNEIVGQHFSKLKTAASLKDMPKYLKMFAAMLRGRTPSLVEFDYIRKDGTFGHGEALSQIVEVEPGKKEALAILRDISDRKRMEDELRNHSERLEELVSERTSELRESEERFRNVIDNLPMGVHMYEIDANGDLRFVAVNPTADKMGTIPSSSYIGKTLDEVFPYVDEEIIEMFKEIAEKGGFWHEEDIRYEDDRIIDASDNYVFQTAPGEMASVFRDVTEQKRMEEALKASEAKYRSFLEEGLDGVVVTWKGEYLYVNQRYTEMLGYSDSSELLGRNTREVIDPRDAERLNAIIEQRQSGDMQRLTYEVRSLKKDGSSIWVGGASSGIEFEGKPAVITYARDITERKQMEEDLLSAERLATAGRVAAMMGHDLHGPLVVVRNAVNLARGNPEKTDRMLDMIERNAGQAMDILEELRTRTKDEPVSLKPVEIEKLLRKITEDLILPTGVGLRLEIDEDLQEIALDETKTVRALKNIIQNAIDAMPDGGVLKIEATSKGNQVVISVSDTGTGIPDEARRNLFKPFYTTKPKGMGLGLASTKRMVAVQGGTISFETRDGKGSTFTITLPLKKNPEQ